LFAAQGLVAFTSALSRAQRTLDLVLEEMGHDLSGLNKDDARKKWGEEQVLCCPR
jgi:2,3-bisphosphoglycerate-dependent phosphoglycerate mutase